MRTLVLARQHAPQLAADLLAAQPGGWLTLEQHDGPCLPSWLGFPCVPVVVRVLYRP